MPVAHHFASQRRVPLPGSEKTPFVVPTQAPSSQQATNTSGTANSGVPARGKAAAKASAPRKTGPNTRVTVTVLVRPRQTLDKNTLGDIANRMTRAQYRKRFGADPVSVRLVKEFAREFGLVVGSGLSSGVAEGRCAILLTGTCAKMAVAFGVALKDQPVNGDMLRVREGAIFIPEELGGHILAVLGLDNRPQATPHSRVARPGAVSVSYTPTQVAQLYSFPAAASASAQTIGLIELGGGFRQTDVKAYFRTLGLPSPKVTAVSVDRGKNSPGTANGPDGEVMLDIEVAGAVAPGAKIAVYFAPNTDQGFIDAISTAVHDKLHKPSVISISWGGPEPSWTMQAVTALDAACQAAAVLGVTITVACGDNGSADVAGGTVDQVDFPASSPHVLACGGTRLAGTGTVIDSEVVWNEIALGEGATGGGVSAFFPLPAWQIGAGVPAPSAPGGGRGVPDVAGDADPTTGYTIRVDGQTIVIGGTSAVAPLWAGLIALSNQANRVNAGFINPTIYAGGARAGAFRDITQGNNGSFSAGPGWDACTGLGSPVGTALIALLALGSAKP